MKIDELIRELEEVREEHGNTKVGTQLGTENALVFFAESEHKKLPL